MSGKKNIDPDSRFDAISTLHFRTYNLSGFTRLPVIQPIVNVPGTYVASYNQPHNAITFTLVLYPPPEYIFTSEREREREVVSTHIKNHPPSGAPRAGTFQRSGVENGEQGMRFRRNCRVRLCH